LFIVPKVINSNGRPRNAFFGLANLIIY